MILATRSAVTVHTVRSPASPNAQPDADTRRRWRARAREKIRPGSRSRPRAEGHIAGAKNVSACAASQLEKYFTGGGGGFSYAAEAEDQPATVRTHHKFACLTPAAGHNRAEPSETNRFECFCPPPAGFPTNSPLPPPSTSRQKWQIHTERGEKIWKGKKEVA